MNTTDIKPDDAVYGMWQGQRICEILGFVGDHEWDKDSILKYLETLVMVHDKWVETNGMYVDDFDNIQPLDFSSKEKQYSQLKNWKLIRDSVMSLAHQYPDREIMDIINKLGITLDDFYAAITVNKKQNKLSEAGFRQFCNAFLNTVINYSQIGRDYGITKSTMCYFKKLFTKERTARTDGLTVV